MSCTDLMLCEITNGVVTFILKLRFESSVVSYGSQTIPPSNILSMLFESSVVSYGSQTVQAQKVATQMFESSVVSYGSQTNVDL